MGLFNKHIIAVETPNSNTINNVEIKPLNGYGAIGEKLDENNTLTVKQQPVEFVKPVLANFDYYFSLYDYLH